MKSIKDDTCNKLIINKSKFITKLFRVQNKDEIDKILDNINCEYKDSTHICFAYIVNGLEKFSDDKEPSGTAGIPILNVLKKNKLDNILAVVIRYYGGIKLGTGRLSRAYSNSIIEALKKTNIASLTYGYLVEMEFSYNNTKLVDYILIDKKIISKEYKDNIIYKFYLNENELFFVAELEKIAIHLSLKDKVLILEN